MSRDTLPEPIAHALDGVRNASLSMIAGAREGSAETIREAIDRRGEAVEALRAAFDSPEGRSVESRIRAQLLESISIASQEVEAELLKLQDRVRDELRSLTDGVRALKGYSRPGSGRKTLDREG